MDTSDPQTTRRAMARDLTTVPRIAGVKTVKACGIDGKFISDRVSV